MDFPPEIFLGSSRLMQGKGAFEMVEREQGGEVGDDILMADGVQRWRTSCSLSWIRSLHLHCTLCNWWGDKFQPAKVEVALLFIIYTWCIFNLLEEDLSLIHI